MGKYIEHTETVQMFLDFEIDPQITTKTGETCVDLAEIAKNEGYGFKKMCQKIIFKIDQSDKYVHWNKRQKIGRATFYRIFEPFFELCFELCF